MGVSAVIPVRNDPDTIAIQIRTLRAENFAGDYEAIVADNGSRGTRDVAGRYVAGTSPVRLVDASQKQGACFVRTVGFDPVRGANTLLRRR